MTQNLDALPTDDLTEFGTRAKRGVRPITFARELFPDRPKGYVRATSTLGNYAWNIIAARGCRLRGDIQTALQYENIAERIYNALPVYARW